MDQFLGSGTTLVEAKLLGRNAIGVDINPKSIELSESNLSFSSHYQSQIHTRIGNASQLTFIKSESIDMICTHPPYADIIKYSEDIQEDISHLSYELFLQKMEDVAREAFRVTKPGGTCAFMIGDIRRNGYVLPLGMNTMQVFMNAGFILKEIVIKEQHNCRSSDYWKEKEKSFLMLAHEYIFILVKDVAQDIKISKTNDGRILN